MTSSDGFNLLDRPWIVVLHDDGREEELSILEVLDQSPNLVTIGGELPTQSFAVTRMLLAFIHRAIDGPGTIADWQRLWEAHTLPTDLLHAYADRHRHRFDLFDHEAPFFQVAGLRTARDETFGLARIIADVPNNEPMFTMRSADSMCEISAAEGARWLVHAHAYDPSGIKSGAVGDPSVKGGKGYPIGPGWSGQIGAVLPQGGNLRETLVLNLVARSLTQYVEIGGARDLPPWERDPDGPLWSERDPHGAIELYTWQTRRVRLAHRGSMCVGAVLANGDKIAPQNRHGLDPHGVWRHSEPQSAKLKRVVYMPKLHQPETAVWRGLSAILPASSGRRASPGQPQRYLAPGVLQFLGELVSDGALDESFTVRTRVVGMEYGAQKATTTDTIDDELPLGVALLRQSDTALGTLAVEAVADAESAISLLGRLATNLAAAAGAGETGASDRARERAAAALDVPYRRWIASVVPGIDRTARRRTWQNDVRSIVFALADDIVRSAGPATWIGRDVRGQTMNAARAEVLFRRGVRKALPLAFGDSTAPETTPPQELPA